MKTRKKIGRHKIALAALFTVGNSLIRLPWREAEPDLRILFFLSVLGAWIPAVLVYPFFQKCYRSPIKTEKKRLFFLIPLSVLLGLYAVFCAYRASDDYLSYAQTLILQTVDSKAFTLCFGICAVLLAMLSSRGLDCFSLLGAMVVWGSVLILFFFGLKWFRPEHLTFTLPNDYASVVSALPAIWSESLLPTVTLSAYFALSTPRKSERALTAGILSGCLILFLCVLQTVLTFGTSRASAYPYPYAYAVRIVSVGQYFFRLEGFSYAFDLLVCLVRSAVSLSCAGRLFARFFPNLRKPATLAFGAGIYLLLLLK